MFRTMRRKNQLLSHQETIEILERGTSGVLSLLGDHGYPYGVPLSYCYVEGRLLFHGGKAGHKLDAIKAYDKASFCVIDQDQVVPDEYTTYFRSAIAFGRVGILEKEEEIMEAIDLLSEKYRPGFLEDRKRIIEKEFSTLSIFEMKIEHLSGKEAIELVKQKTTE